MRSRRSTSTENNSTRYGQTSDGMKRTRYTKEGFSIHPGQKGGHMEKQEMCSQCSMQQEHSSLIFDMQH